MRGSVFSLLLMLAVTAAHGETPPPPCPPVVMELQAEVERMEQRVADIRRKETPASRHRKHMEKKLEQLKEELRRAREQAGCL